MVSALPVDVVTSWTDIASLVIDGFAAIGTVGALWFLARAYSRQVSDDRRRQAKDVSVRLTNRQHAEGQDLLLWVHNDSDHPIAVKGFFIPNVPQVHSLLVDDVGPDEDVILFAGESRAVGKVVYNPSIRLAFATFADAAGRVWIRDTAGGLQTTRRREPKFYS